MVLSTYVGLSVLPTLFSLARLIIFVIFVEVASFFFCLDVVINADVYVFMQGEVFARCVVLIPGHGSGVGQAAVKGLIPRGGLVRLLTRVLDSVKRS